MSRGNGGVTIDNFVEAWRNGIVIDDGQIAQTIKNLPAGIYRLECDATAAWTNDENVEAKGIHLFAGSNRKAIATVGYEPQHFSLSFENTTAGDVTIGIRINETNTNWVAMDNVRLYYEGEVAAIPQGADLVSDPDARVYLYNVETGKYLSAGHSWRTHAILDETGLPVRLTQDAQTGLWQVYFWEGSQLDRLLFKVYSDYPEDEVCVDYNHDYDKADENLTWWSFTKTGDGSYVIQNKTNLGTDKWLGNVPTRQDYQNGYSGISYTDVICTASQNDNSHWLIFTKDDCDLIAAKYRLMSAILRMEESETVNEDLLTTAQGIYDDDNVTTEEVIAVTTLLNSQMGMPKKDQPVEMTALIINPRFEDNTTEGWTGATVVGGRADATSNHEQEFYEKNFNMYQTITGVPNGLYRVKFEAFHRPGSCEDVYEDYMSGSNKASAIFYANNVQKTLKNWASESGNADLGDWEQYGEYYPNSMEAARKHFDAGHYADYLDVEVTDNVLTIGFRNTQEMTVCQWVVFSDLELYILENADQQNNKLTVADMKCVQGGQATLAVNLKNADAISAFQFDLKLPEGIHVATNTSGKLQASLTNRKIDHSFSSRQLDANTYAFTALSLSSSDFRGNDGAVVNITLTTDEDKALGEFAILLKNIELTKPNGLNVLPFDVTAKLTISNLTNGDVNGDGRVSITDAVYIVNYVLRQPASDFHAEAADLNGDGKITITDAVQIVNIILSQGRSVKASELPADWQQKEMMED